MGQSNVVNQFASSTLLLPAIDPNQALMNVFPVTLGANVVYSRGNLLVPVAASANDVQTLAVTGNPTGGTYTLTGIHPVTGVSFTTTPLNYNAADADIQNALTAAIGPGATVANLVVTFAGSFATQPIVPLTATSSLTGGTNPGVTVTHTTTGVRAATYTLYTGTGTPTCWLKTDVSTDAIGNVYYGPSLTGYRRMVAEAYFAGSFYAAEIPNLDANAINAMKARFICGALGVAGAIIRFA